MTIDYVERARALVGTRFRPQGRGEGGLDCVGVVLATFGIPVDAVRRDYRLRGDHEDAIRNALKLHFQEVPKQQLRSGDVILLAPGRRQFHLAVLTSNGFVHADARHRQVVETPGAPEWPVIGSYRVY